MSSSSSSLSVRRHFFHFWPEPDTLPPSGLMYVEYRWPSGSVVKVVIKFSVMIALYVDPPQ